MGTRRERICLRRSVLFDQWRLQESRLMCLLGSDTKASNHDRPEMPEIPRHPNKDIRQVTEYAFRRGWRLEKAGARAHILGHPLLSLPAARWLHSTCLLDAEKLG